MLNILYDIVWSLFQVIFCITHMIIEIRLLSMFLTELWLPADLSINVKQRNTEYHQF